MLFRSLALQGGPMSDTEVAAFRMTEGWKDALQVRRIDELAKDPDRRPPDFIDFAPEILSLASPTSRSIALPAVVSLDKTNPLD